MKSKDGVRKLSPLQKSIEGSNKMTIILKKNKKQDDGSTSLKFNFTIKKVPMKFETLMQEDYKNSS
jgi:hypothetical protein